MKQVLVILLDNALQFTPSEGRVTLQVKPNESKNELELTDQDTGIGIEEHHMSKLFTMYAQINNGFQWRYGASGRAGLALVASLTNLLRGNVAGESTGHAGSKFTETIPLIAESKEKFGMKVSYNGNSPSKYVDKHL